MTTGMSNNNVPGLALDQYREQIKLDEPYEPAFSRISSDEERIDIVDELLDVLINHEGLAEHDQLPDEYEQKRQLVRALLNVRPPNPLDTTFLKNINRLLRDETQQKKFIDCIGFLSVGETIPTTDLKNRDKIFLWKGDITCLKADAIVNAANDRMLGCFKPLHNCIDNVIHSAAGPLLRQDCKIIMDISNCPEQTGDAKITRAYNLPSKYVLHTVGPIIQGKEISEYQADQLASCYRSCLSLAAQVQDIRNIAFPCISTGVFNFPRDLASEIAIKTVDEWLSSNSHHFTHVIFNVFLEEDLDCYARLFRGSNS
jgi:O-acetyl-ADP-ribose deacetylase (regulator of RNase III)